MTPGRRSPPGRRCPWSSLRPAGFHLTHLLLLAVIPALAWWSVCVTAGASRDAAWLAAGVAAIFCVGYASPLVRTGDTQVLAGAVAAFATLTAARALRASDVEGLQGGLVPAFALVVSLALAGIGPPAFFCTHCCFWRSTPRPRETAARCRASLSRRGPRSSPAFPRRGICGAIRRGSWRAGPRGTRPATRPFWCRCSPRRGSLQ